MGDVEYGRGWGRGEGGLPPPWGVGLIGGRQGCKEEWAGLRGSAGVINDESGVYRTTGTLPSYSSAFSPPLLQSQP